jgi:hypothetical protein
MMVLANIFIEKLLVLQRTFSKNQKQMQIELHATTYLYTRIQTEQKKINY